MFFMIFLLYIRRTNWLSFILCVSLACYQFNSFFIKSNVSEVYSEVYKYDRKVQKIYCKHEVDVSGKDLCGDAADITGDPEK